VSCAHFCAPLKTFSGLWEKQTEDKVMAQLIGRPFKIVALMFVICAVGYFLLHIIVLAPLDRAHDKSREDMKAAVSLAGKMSVRSDGNISLMVTSDGTTGEEWIGRLQKKGFSVGENARIMLRSNDFKPTKGVTTRIVVIKGASIIATGLTDGNIRAEASKMKLVAPNAEVACLIREMFTDQELKAMGVWWIVTMHEPIKSYGGKPALLYVTRDFNGMVIDGYPVGSGDPWDTEGGFAFAVSEPPDIQP
jgi:hypothetical protein